MPRIMDPAKQLEDTISRLEDQRQYLLSELARINAIFERFGIQPREHRRPGRLSARVNATPVMMDAKPARKGRQRKRGTFKTSGFESMLAFIKNRGDKGATTSEVNKFWESEGRAGTAYVTLGQLTKKRKVKRENLKGERGSRYTAP